MFRAKRSDTTVGSIEATYGINLNARGDMLLRNLLRERGFVSLTQLIKAYRGRLTYHPRKRHLFLSFHANNRKQVDGFRLMAQNQQLSLDVYDGSVRVPINSERASYVRKVIREKIWRTEVLVCLIGNGTAWREWVEWEIETAKRLRKGICGVRLKGSRAQIPEALSGFLICPWNLDCIIAAIEGVAARRS
jgi:MTH538 TIR-like domain (DUF1863)